MFWVYMLRCADRSFYVGHTDISKRELVSTKPASIRPVTPFLADRYSWCSRNPLRLVKKRLPWRERSKLEQGKEDGTDIR